jgi:hypothetical protein
MKTTRKNNAAKDTFFLVELLKIYSNNLMELTFMHEII